MSNAQELAELRQTVNKVTWLASVTLSDRLSHCRIRHALPRDVWSFMLDFLHPLPLVLKRVKDVIDDQVVAELVNQLPRLSDIELLLPSVSCREFSDVPMFAIAAKCPKLDRLVVSGQITDQGLLAVARGCPNLKVLNVNHCPLLTDASVMEMVKLCPRLTHLSIGGCDNLTDVCLGLATHLP
jgi:hypothetical protein